MTDVLMISHDATLTAARETVADSRRRHIIYAEAYHRAVPNGKLIILAPSLSGEAAEAWLSPEVLVVNVVRKPRLTYAWRCFRQGLKLALRFRFAVVTTQSPFDDGLAGYALARRCHAGFLPQLRGDFFSAGWRHERWPLQLVASWLAVRLLRRADAIHVVSEALRGALIRRGIPRQNIVVNPGAITFQPFTFPSAAERLGFRQRFGIRDDEVVVVTVGDFSYAKNVPLLLQVIEGSLRQGVRARFVLIGQGPGLKRVDHWRQRHPRLARAVLTTGGLSYHAVAQWYAAADLCLLTSRYEGLPRVLREAAASGLPIVTTDVSGASEIVRDGVTGFILAQGDTDGVMGAVRRLIRDPRLRRTFGQRSPSWERERFPRDRIIADRVALWALTGRRP